ncbi:MAG: FlgD immunoglobulin-like domain containing protein, partial [Candidatus Eiseniibacteriota bacterium]
SGAVDRRWPADGVPVCSAPGDQWATVVLADGAGGVLVAWHDQRSLYNLDIYAQHVLASGVVDPAWPRDGLVVCAAPNEQSFPVMAGDGAGGAIVAWKDARNGVTDVYAQHVLASGLVDPAWPANGLAVCTAGGGQHPQALLPDDMGGALVVWNDLRHEDNDVYAHHILASGRLDPAWPAEGLAVATGPKEQGNARMVTDGGDGALISWTATYRGANGTYIGYYDLYAHHLLASGVLDPAWPPRGLGICTAPGDQLGAIGMPDGNGGAFAVWQDERREYGEIYAQHLLAEGMVDSAWPVDGLPIITGPPFNRSGGRIAPDGSGGVIMVWNEVGIDDWEDIRTQHLLGSGTLDPAWPPMGYPVSAAPRSQDEFVIVAGAPGHAIVAWKDGRNGFLNDDIYARRINVHSVGKPAGKGRGLSLEARRAGPAAREVALGFELPIAEAVSLEVFDVAGRRVRTLVARQDLGAGPHRVTWDGADDAGTPIRHGVYLARLSGERESLTRKLIVLE